MRFERLIDTHDERYCAARALYAASFPYHEQREDGAQAAAGRPAHSFGRALRTPGMLAYTGLCAALILVVTFLT